EAAAQELRQQAMAPASVGEQGNTAFVSESSSPRLNRLVLRQASLALQRRAIRQFLTLVQQAAPSFEQIEEMTALITAPNRSQTSSLPTGMIAIVEDDWIVLRQARRVEG
ncbi:MAG: TilS substrate-binding domain-containing protein, partial [Cyanobacteriota bacterium]